MSNSNLTFCTFSDMTIETMLTLKKSKKPLGLNEQVAKNTRNVRVPHWPKLIYKQLDRRRIF